MSRRLKAEGFKRIQKVNDSRPVSRPDGKDSYCRRRLVTINLFGIDAKYLWEGASVNLRRVANRK